MSLDYKEIEKVWDNLYPDGDRIPYEVHSFGEAVCRAVLAKASQQVQGEIEVTPEMLAAAQKNSKLGGYACSKFSGGYSAITELFQVMFEASKAMPAPKQEPLEAVIARLVSLNDKLLKNEQRLIEELREISNAQAAAIPEAIAKQIWAHGYDRGHNDGLGCGHDMAPRCRHDSGKEADHFADEIQQILSAAPKPEESK